MYRPKPGREQEQRRHSPVQGSYIRTVLPVLTVVFWVCVAAIAVYALTQSMGGWLTWTTGLSLLVVMVGSGAIAWIEFRSNPEEDAERGEWTNRMLFLGLCLPARFLWRFYTG